MMNVEANLTPADLLKASRQVFALAVKKIDTLDRTWDRASGAPVFTVAGQYTARGWTEWTQGFQYGCALLAFDATDDQRMLQIGRARTVEGMAAHLTHVGVHDHGFNNVSTYGNLRRLMLEGRLPANDWELAYYELALRCSGAVQASRWADIADGLGFIYSFNGPHSLFIDTLRTLRSLAVGHQLGQVLMGENDARHSLLSRLLLHATTTAKFSIYYGEHRDSYDLPELRGRTVHEAIFNRNDGRFRCPNSQQGYSPFSTWTRGLAWAILGFAEEIEFLKSLPVDTFEGMRMSQSDAIAAFEKSAIATAEFYLTQASARDGIAYWDTGAPGLQKLGDWQDRPADPFNDHEPVDSSASAIAAQGLIRLGRHLGGDNGSRYLNAGLGVANTLFAAPYLSLDEKHQGLLLHSVYHRPNGWDYCPPGSLIPRGESSMWGDYHLLELTLLIQRLATQKPYYTFFGPVKE